MNPTTPGPAEALRSADRIEHGDRERTYVWDLEPDPEGGTRQAVLSIMHHKYARGGAFTATVRNRTVNGNEIGMGDITTFTRIAAQSTPRYSKPGLNEFAASALTALTEKYTGDGDESQLLRGYFQPQTDAA
jgi:hypothetical protein